MAATANASDEVWQQRRARISSKDRSLQPRRPSSTGSNLRETSCVAGKRGTCSCWEAQPHRFVARSLQTLHERVVAEEVAHQEGKITENTSAHNSFMSDLAGVPAAAHGRGRGESYFLSYRHGLFLRECGSGRLPLRASGRDEMKVVYVGGVQRQLQCSGLRHLRQHVC